MKVFFAIVLGIVATASAAAAGLPGFRVEKLGRTAGFLTSLAVDSKGTIYYTAQDGGIYRFDDGASTPIGRVATVGISDSGLLGMAFIDDETVALHYTTPAADPEYVTHDVVSRLDLRTGGETILHRFVCDIDVPERGASPEHHGGNPVVAPDGSIFVGIGDYSGRALAQLPGWNGGRIWRVYPDGTAVEYVIGLRNPFDFVWDEAKQRLVIPDNGPIGREDELDVVSRGANCGWPWAFGFEAHPEGTTPPVYVWREAIVPTGTLSLSGVNGQLRSGIVIAGFYSHAIHYIRDIDDAPMPDPIDVLGTSDELIDVAEARDGTIYIASALAIYKVIVPQRGDCDGDGLVNASDFRALTLEIADGPRARTDAQDGSHRGSWGCDANGDDRIDAADLSALAAMVGRRRSIGIR